MESSHEWQHYWLCSRLTIKPEVRSRGDLLTFFRITRLFFIIFLPFVCKCKHRNQVRITWAHYCNFASTFISKTAENIPLTMFNKTYYTYFKKIVNENSTCFSKSWCKPRHLFRQIIKFIDIASRLWQETEKRES